MTVRYKQRLRKPSSRYAVTHPSASRHCGPIVWGWFFFKWRATSLMVHLSQQATTCHYDWTVLTTDELDEAWKEFRT